MPNQFTISSKNGLKFAFETDGVNTAWGVRVTFEPVNTAQKGLQVTSIGMTHIKILFIQ